MPAGFLKLKKSLRKQFPRASKDRIETMAAKIWNKKHKGTGQTVGRGRD